MAISKKKKGEIIEKLGKAVSKAASLVFVNFHGLPVQDSTSLRKALRSKSIGYTVAKKTLIKRALDELKPEGELPVLPGEVALVYGDDPTLPASEIYAFQKDHKEQMKILGGVFGGKYMDAAAMTAIATIPSKEVLIAQFVNLINSPIQRFAVVLSEVAKQKETV